MKALIPGRTRLGQTVLRAVEPMPWQPREPGVGEHLGQLVGHGQVRYAELQIEHILRGESGHRGGADVVGAAHQRATRAAEAAQDRLGLHRPSAGRSRRRRQLGLLGSTGPLPGGDVGSVRGDPVPPERGDLGFGTTGCAVVVDPDVRNPRPGGIIGLCRHPGADLLRGHPPVPLQPGDARGLARPSHQDQVVLGGKVVLHDQGHVVHHDGVGRQVRQPRPGLRSHERVHDGVQSPERCVITEHCARQGGSVQAAVRSEDPGSEFVGDGGQTRGARFEHLPGDPVGVDQVRAARGEHGGDSGLAGTDSPGETNVQHGRPA